MPDLASIAAQLDDALDSLEQEMPLLQARTESFYSLANAWSERHDAIVAATPHELMADVEARLRRIGIRWGLMPGVRLTGQIPALPPPQSAPKSPPGG